MSKRGRRRSSLDDLKNFAKGMDEIVGFRGTDAIFAVETAREADRGESRLPCVNDAVERVVHVEGSPWWDVPFEDHSLESSSFVPYLRDHRMKEVAHPSTSKVFVDIVN